MKSCFFLQWYRILLAMQKERQAAPEVDVRGMDECYWSAELKTSVRRCKLSRYQEGRSCELPSVHLEFGDALALQRLVSLAAERMSRLPFKVYSEGSFASVAEGKCEWGWR